MGQKVHPYGFRLGTLYGWQSNWFAERHYGQYLHEDIRIRDFIKQKLYHAGISRVVIDRTGEKLVVNIHTARPGILIGKRGAEVENLRKELARFSAKEIFINIREIRKAELDAQLVAESVSMQLERRVAFRRAMKKAVTSTMKFGAGGVRIQCAGRLGGTPFTLGSIDATGLAPGLFLPISVLNDLRQEAVHQLADRTERQGSARAVEREAAVDVALSGVTTSPSESTMRLTAEVWRLEDARAAIRATESGRAPAAWAGWLVFGS